MFCTNCGTRIPEGMAFCEQCGQPVRRRHTAASAGGQMRAASPAYGQAYGQTYTGGQARTSSYASGQTYTGGQAQAASPVYGQARAASQAAAPQTHRGMSAAPQGWNAAPQMRRQTMPAAASSGTQTLAPAGRFSPAQLLTVQGAAAAYMALSGGILLHELTLLAGGTYHGSMKISAIFCCVIMLLCLLASALCTVAMLDTLRKSGRRSFGDLVSEPCFWSSVLPMLSCLLSIPAMLTGGDLLIAICRHSTPAAIRLADTYNGMGMGVRIFALQISIAAAIIAVRTVLQLRRQSAHARRQACAHNRGAVPTAW